MLQGMTVASPPAALMPSATSLQASAFRDEITTLAPSLARSSAEERPMPRLEPVTIATLPVRSNGVFFIGAGAPLNQLAPSLRGAKRRSNPDCLNGKILDCFASLAMTTWRDPGLALRDAPG